MRPTFLILQTGHPTASMRRHGSFAHWIRVAAGLGDDEVVVIDVEHDEPLPTREGFAGVFVTGSGAMVTDQLPWSEASAAWLRDAAHAGLPLLGICYGHQLLAHALGGQVGYNPAGREMGTVDVALQPDAGWRSVVRRPAGAVHGAGYPPADGAGIAGWRSPAGDLATGCGLRIPLGPACLGRAVPSRIQHRPHARLYPRAPRGTGRRSPWMPRRWSKRCGRRRVRASCCTGSWRSHRIDPCGRGGLGMLTGSFQELPWTYVRCRSARA